MGNIGILVRILLLLQSVGLAALFYLHSSKLSHYLFLNLGWTESSTRWIDFIQIALLLIIGVGSLWRLKVTSLLTAFAIFLTQAYFTFVLGGKFWSELSLLTQLSRYGWPLIIGAFMMSQKGSRVSPIPVLALRFVIGITFLAHGFEAFILKPQFIDYVIAGADKLLGMSMNEFFAGGLLRVIAVIDLVVGLAIIFSPRPSIIIYMMAWGFATAAMRIVFSSSLGVPDFLIRAPHWGLPLIIYMAMFLKHSKRADQKQKSPAASELAATEVSA